MAGDAEVVELSESRAANLRKWNLITAGIHLLCGVVIFGITSQDNTVAIVTTYANPDGRETPNWLPLIVREGKAVVGYYSGVFLLLCFLDHFLVATLFRSQYEWYLKRAQNPFRWVEYSVSAAVMRIEIAQLSGMMDIHLLIAVFGLASATMLFGLLQERMTSSEHGNPKEKSLLAFWLGCVPHLFSWAIVMSYFFHGVSNGDPPGFVWAIIFILFILDSTFAIAMYLQQKEIGKWKDYIYGEYTYIILSLSAKLLLAWINYGGTNSL